jgi:hypothetical protein
MSMRLLLLCAMLLAGGCSHHGEFYLWDAGYTISHRAEGFAFELHRNQFKYLGGDVDSARFRRFVFEQLTRHEGCEGGWELLPCVADRSCVTETWLSVTVFARCTKA